MFNPVLDPPCHLTGAVQFLLGVFFFPFTFYLIQRFLKSSRIGHWLCGQYNLSNYAIYDISNKFTSSVFAFLACSCGLFVLSRCVNSEHSSSSRYYILDNYLIFGVSYFFYDCGAMFIVFSHEHYNKVLYSKEVFQRFFAEKTLILLHHLLVPLIGFPAIMISRDGYGDCLLGTAFLVEASTPFVSLRVILCHLGLKKSKLYIVNGVVMLASFFLFRVCIFPALYIWYVSTEGLGSLLSLPLWNHCAVMGLWAPQLVWFNKMIKGTIKLLSAANSPKNHQN